MYLTDLPEDILIIIMKKLDLKSLECMYHTCILLRNIICVHRVISKCNMSMNVMATSNTLKSNFFKLVSRHIIELNLCGVPDLNSASLLPAMKQLKSLKTLDISFTNITLTDLSDICDICPTIVNVSINFVFFKPGSEITNIYVTIPETIMSRCQLIFARFENIHLVGSENNLFFSKLAHHMIENSKLNSVKYTIINNYYLLYAPINYPLCIKSLDINHFAMYTLNWRENQQSNMCLNYVFRSEEWDKYEFIIINMMNGFSFSLVRATPLFDSFFKENFYISVDYSIEFDKPLSQNTIVMCWNKKTTIFDNNFFHNLKKDLRKYLPYTNHIPSDPHILENFDRFYVTPKPPEFSIKPESYIKKRRIVAPNFVLNYDTILKQKSKVRLSIDFYEHIPSAVMLTKDCEYLKKLTFLSLNGRVRYNQDFFKVIFQCCVNLITLNVIATSLSPCAALISNSINLTHSLKNFRLVDKQICFKLLFLSLSECRTLENIHIVEEKSNEICVLGNPSIVVEKCNNLYNLYIEAQMTQAMRSENLKLLNKSIASYNKHHLRIVLNDKSYKNKYRFNYDPFVDVFNLISLMSS